MRALSVEKLNEEYLDDVRRRIADAAARHGNRDCPELRAEVEVIAAEVAHRTLRLTIDEAALVGAAVKP